jgi:hypothetical protein
MRNLAFALALALPASTLVSAVSPLGAQQPQAVALAAPADSAGIASPAPASVPGAQPPATRISAWHARRLAIHRVTAWTIPPLFLAQYLVGQELYRGIHSESGEADWVRPAHRTGAALIGTAFVINATTGVWNLWASRKEPEGRVARVLHGTSMIVAAGGFTYAGVRLSEQAKFSPEKRDQHRLVALSSMGLTLVSGTAMWFANR